MKLPTGEPLPGWSPPPRPPRSAMEGAYCSVQPLDPARHVAGLHSAFAADAEDIIWTYLPYGPFGSESGLSRWIEEHCLGEDPLFFAIVDRESGRAAGVASYLRIAPECASIEVGHINYSPSLQRSRAATEAMFLMMRRAFSELGYRRYEWKCDALNERSKRAALRLGFTHEGIFRQARIYKGRNRDDAWFSVIDREWPDLERAYAEWLAPENFDAQGRQKASLGDLIGASRA